MRNVIITLAGTSSARHQCHYHCHAGDYRKSVKGIRINYGRRALGMPHKPRSDIPEIASYDPRRNVNLAHDVVYTRVLKPFGMYSFLEGKSSGTRVLVEYIFRADLFKFEKYNLVLPFIRGKCAGSELCGFEGDLFLFSHLFFSYTHMRKQEGYFFICNIKRPPYLICNCERSPLGLIKFYLSKIRSIELCLAGSVS